MPDSQLLGVNQFLVLAQEANYYQLSQIRHANARAIAEYGQCLPKEFAFIFEKKPVVEQEKMLQEYLKIRIEASHRQSFS